MADACGGGRFEASRRSRACSTGRPARGRRPTRRWRGSTPVRTRDARLAAAVTPDGMRARLADTRALLARAGGRARTLDAWLARDPLRLSQVPWEARAELAAGVAAEAGGAFVADEGRARLVVARAARQRVRTRTRRGRVVEDGGARGGGGGATGRDDGARGRARDRRGRPSGCCGAISR